MMKKLSFFIATLFGVGYIKKMPGTFGSLASFLIIIPTMYHFGLAGLVTLIFASFIIGYFTTRKVLKYTAHDPKFIVIDELVGQSISILPFAFVFAYSKTFTIKYVMDFFFPTVLLICLISFILFRFFDIKKPSLVGYFDRKVENAFGVMFDDVVAGIFAAISLVIIMLFISFPIVVKP